MAILDVLLLFGIFFATSCISVITGSTSLITVPAMFQFRIDPRIAVATNMFALTFMSVGGSLPFLRPPVMDRKRLLPLILITLCGSAAGAFLLLNVRPQSVSLIVSAAMIGIAVFSTVYRKPGMRRFTAPPSRASEVIGYVLTFVLGIYGGFFSGGYVTILTAIYVAVFRLSFVEAVATTKVINIFSSGVATVIFMWRHIVDYRLGIILGLAAFGGALVGARFAVRLGSDWLRRIFLTVVWALGLKTLVFDVLVGPPAPEHKE
jgi:uncharacterized protein